MICRVRNKNTRSRFRVQFRVPIRTKTRKTLTTKHLEFWYSGEIPNKNSNGDFPYQGPSNTINLTIFFVKYKPHRKFDKRYLNLQIRQPHCKIVLIGKNLSSGRKIVFIWKSISFENRSRLKKTISFENRSRLEIAIV